jgi:hypothetical protein
LIRARGHRQADYTPHQRWLSERLHAALPDLESEARAKLAGMGEPRFDAPAPVHPGEVAAVWVLLSQAGVKGNALIRIGMSPIAETGGEA